MTERDGVSGPIARDAESASHLVDALRDNLKDAEKGISRQLVLITILSAFFILLARNQIGQITFQAVPIINHYFVQAFLPIIIAALYLSTVNTMQMAIELIRVQDKLIRQFQPEIHNGYAERLLWPSTGAFAALAALPVLLKSKTAKRTTSVSSWMRYFLYFGAPIGMIVYSAWFLLSHSPGPLQYTAVILSLIIVTQPFILLFSIVPAVVRLSSGNKVDSDDLEPGSKTSGS
jgi:hypothetical protein